MTLLRHVLRQPMTAAATGFAVMEVSFLSLASPNGCRERIGRLTNVKDHAALPGGGHQTAR